MMEKKGVNLGIVLAGLGKPKGGHEAEAESETEAEPTVSDEEGAAAVAELKAALDGDDDVATWKKFRALSDLASKCGPMEMSDEE